MRKITIFNTSNQRREEIESSATTYGEISSSVNPNGDQKVMIRETKATLEHKDAALPEGDFTIFLFPSKVKSGLDAEDYDNTPSGVLDAMESLSAENRVQYHELNEKLERLLDALEGKTPANNTSALAKEAAEMAPKKAPSWDSGW